MAQGTRTPPPPNFFFLKQFWGTVGSNKRLVFLSLQARPPPSGKPWIRHWNRTIEIWPILPFILSSNLRETRIMTSAPVQQPADARKPPWWAYISIFKTRNWKDHFQHCSILCVKLMDVWITVNLIKFKWSDICILWLSPFINRPTGCALLFLFPVNLPNVLLDQNFNKRWLILVQKLLDCQLNFRWCYLCRSLEYFISHFLPTVTFQRLQNWSTHPLPLAHTYACLDDTLDPNALHRSIRHLPISQTCQTWDPIGKLSCSSGRFIST